LPHSGKIFLATPGKIQYSPPLEEILPTPMGRNSLNGFELFAQSWICLLRQTWSEWKTFHSSFLTAQCQPLIFASMVSSCTVNRQITARSQRKGFMYFTCEVKNTEELLFGDWVPPVACRGGGRTGRLPRASKARGASKDWN